MNTFEQSDNGKDQLGDDDWFEDASFLTVGDFEPDPLGNPEAPDPFEDSTESVLGRDYLNRELGLPEPAPVFDTEEAFNDFVDELKNRLTILGIADPGSIDADSTRLLVSETYMDVCAAEDLYYLVWDDLKDKFGRFSRVKTVFLLEGAATNDQIRLQKELDDDALRTLYDHGIRMDDVMDAQGNHLQKRNLRRLAWLLNTEPALEQVSTFLKTTAKAQDDARIRSLYELANHVHDTIGRTRDGLKSIDVNTMDTAERLYCRAEIHRLRYVLALSQSVAETTSENPQ